MLYYSEIKNHVLNQKNPIQSYTTKSVNGNIQVLDKHSRGKDGDFIKVLPIAIKLNKNNWQFF